MGEPSEAPIGERAAGAPPGRGWRLAGWLLALACVGFAARGASKALRPEGSDFTIYREAGCALLEGRDPFTVEHYLYPPSFALLMAPFSAAPYPLAVGLWQLLSLLALLGSVRLSAALCVEPGVRPHPALSVVPLLVALRLADSNLANGQVNAMTLFLCLLALHRARAGSGAAEVRSGAWIGVGAAVKVLPAILLLPAVLRRRARLLLGCAGAGLVLAAAPAAFLGWSGNLRSLDRWRSEVLAPRLDVPVAGERAPVPGQSLKATAHRLLTDTPATSQAGADARANVARLSPEAVERLVQALSLLFLLALLATLVRRPAPVGSPDGSREAALLLLTPLLVAPLVHKAHALWILPALAHAVSRSPRWWRTSGGRVRLGLAGLAALLVGGTTPALLGRHRATWLLSMNVVFFAVLALWVALLLEAWSAAGSRSRPGKSGGSGERDGMRAPRTTVRR